MSNLPQNNLKEQLARHSTSAQSKMSLAKPKSGPFSFKKKSPSGTNLVETLSKVTSPNVLASRNVNVPKTNLVTQPVVMFSNKPETAQKSKISNFFSVSSKDKSDISLSSLASFGKVCPSTPKLDRPGMSNNVSTPVNLDASLGIQLDDWDDLDDFETSTKAKNTSLNEDVNKTDCRPVTAERKTESIGGQCHLKTDEIQAMPDQTEVQQPAESEPEDSPINIPRRRQSSYQKSVVSESEEDNDDVPMTDDNKKCVDPESIKLDVTLEPEDDLDYIPPSPESYYSKSPVESM